MSEGKAGVQEVVFILTVKYSLSHCASTAETCTSLKASVEGIALGIF